MGSVTAPRPPPAPLLAALDVQAAVAVAARLVGHHGPDVDSEAVGGSGDQGEAGVV